MITYLSFRTYSCVVTFESAILICAHLCEFGQWDEHATLDGSCEDVWTSMQKYPDIQFKVFSGMDASVTLPGGLQGITEGNVITTKTTYRRILEQLLGWMGRLGIREMNTYRPGRRSGGGGSTLDEATVGGKKGP